jgi:hypothetical protein
MIASSFVNTPRIGGWLCATHCQIEFTPEEKRKLEVIGKAAEGIARCWDVLLKISARIGRDFEPVDTCVSLIADYCAASIDDRRAVELLDPDSVAEYFSDPENWKSYAPQVEGQ